jgi:hypothetical protein
VPYPQEISRSRLPQIKIWVFFARFTVDSLEGCFTIPLLTHSVKVKRERSDNELELKKNFAPGKRIPEQNK